MASDAETLVHATIRELLRRRDIEIGTIDVAADIYDDLELDSLEVAELSATLEDHFGTDPYSAGESPRIVGEIIGFFPV